MSRIMSTLLCVFIVTCLVSTKSHASNDIDVLVALAPEVYDQNPAIVAGQLEILMKAALVKSSLLGHDVNFRPFIVPSSYPYGNSGSGSQALSFIVNGNDSILNIAREGGGFTIDAEGIEAYDLVVLVVERLEKTDQNGVKKQQCGFGSLFYIGNLRLSPMDSENPDKRFGIVLSDECEDHFDTAIAHELGHVLGGDHQVGSAVVTDSNEPPPLDEIPVDYNHPIFHEAGSGSTGIVMAASVMFGKAINSVIAQYSTNSPGATLFGTGFDAGNSKANMISVIDQTWDAVAAYRPIPEPQACNIRVEFYGCSNNSASNAITATLPGFSVVNADYDLSYNNSSWFDLFEGILTCPSFSSSASMWARAILTTASGQISECTVRVPVGDCDDDIWIF